MMRRIEHAGDLPDLGPEAYARWRSSEIGAITERLERALVIELIGEASGQRILDVGCGDGALACDLARRGARVTGIDASAAMIAAARDRARQLDLDVVFVVANADELPFPSTRFDIVTAVTILCFVDDAVPAFREAARVLRPGGRLVIGELGRWSSWAAERRIRSWLGPSLWRRARFRGARELRRLAAGAGLEVETVRGAVYYPRFRLAARLLGPHDAAFGQVTTIGAAFVALTAVKPEAPDDAQPDLADDRGRRC